MEREITESQEARAQGGGKEVLVVDDEPTLRIGFRTALQMEGYTVCTAASGECALQLIAEHEFNVVVLDLRMPGIDGIEVARRLADFPPMVPCILASSHIQSAVISQALRVGIVDFLAKPVRPDDLRKKVRLVLNEEASFRTTGSRPEGAELVSSVRSLLRRRQVAAASRMLAADEHEGGEPRQRAFWTRIVEIIRTNPDHEAQSIDHEVSFSQLIRGQMG